MAPGEGYTARRVQPQDYEGVIKTLAVLTTVGSVTRTQFEDTVKYWNSIFLPQPHERVYKYNPYVIVQDATGEIAATGNMIIEKKIIHDCGIVGHIEDIAVSKDHQGKQLGRFLIDKLTQVGMESGCYKIILDCDEKNTRFYEKCGYSRAGVEMQIRAHL